MNRETLLAHRDSPSELESLYRQAPAQFRKCLGEISPKEVDSLLFQFWRERLAEGSAAALIAREHPQWNRSALAIVIVLVFIVGSLGKLPLWFDSLDGPFFYRNGLAFLILAPLGAYFAVRQRNFFPWPAGGLLAGLAGVVFLMSLPREGSPAITLSAISMPFFFGSLVALVFLGANWKISSARIEFLRYGGELLIYTTIILVGGLIFTGITMFLFGLLEVSDERIFSTLLIYGGLASPLVATFLIREVLPEKFRIAPLLAKIFTPLFVLTVLGFLVVMVALQKSPVTDRDFLIAINILLLAVLGLVVFSVVEREPEEVMGLSDYFSIVLILGTLLINAVALAAIWFRLSEMGMTPNRLVVLGTNLLIFGQLVGLAFYYIRALRKDRLGAELPEFVGRYLPIYSAWAVLVAFGMPMFFPAS